MRKAKILIGLAAIAIGFLAIYYVFKNENTLVTHPKGVIAHHELNLIITNFLLMLIVIVPTFIWLLVTAWKYRENNTTAQFEPEKSHKQPILWIAPSIIIAVMTVITWHAAHKLDPSVPIKSEKKPVRIQVVAMDWKWLFIYPEQEIATLNYLHFPAETPIEFKLSADGSPMNSFWIPQLSGQIYAMTGMVTPLHIMADHVGTYSGKASEINGEGYADMTFTVKASSQAEFTDWVASVKKSSEKLTDPIYNELSKRAINSKVIFYSQVEKELFHKIIMKNM